MLMAAKMPALALFLPLVLLSPLMAVLGSEKTNTSFVFQSFNSTSNLIFIDNAMVRDPGVVRLTNDTSWIIGRVLYGTPLQLKQNGTISPFSTTFVMAMVPPAGAAGTGHGIAFLLTPTTSLMGAASAEYLGLFNDTSTDQPYNHIFAVEFDTSQNVEFADPDANHVGLDLNSLTSNATHYAGYHDAAAGNFVNVTLKTGRNIQVWIDYRDDQINVTLAPAGMQRPAKPVLSVKNLNLSGILTDQPYYIGFSSATGNFVAEHYILAWSFATGGAPPAELNAAGLPPLMWRRRRPLYRTPAFVGLLCLAAILAALAAFTAKRWFGNRETVEEWEKEFWPHRFSFKVLSAATKGFSEGEVLGAGGFGRVYRGVLPGTGQTVAVKSVKKEIKDGIKEFVAEISSMGRMQHRNLVPLRGWCRQHKHLFLVYDFMPHGSLDGVIFNRGAAFSWRTRFHVVKGVAAGLLYLHEQWEKCVVHRDIKSSNVLLDADMNGRLGDFGLAKLYDHSENPETTRVVGTLGYIAPELLYSGKASPASDVYSFGVVLLEVGSGRKPVDPGREENEAILVDWVWDLYGKERIMEAADPRLMGDFNGGEMERVLCLGLSCCHLRPERRLGIRQVLQVLEGEAELPVLSVPSMHSSLLGSTPRSGFFSFSSDSKGSVPVAPEALSNHTLRHHPSSAGRDPP